MAEVCLASNILSSQLSLTLYPQILQFQAPSGAVKKVSLTHTNEVNKKVEGKAEAEVTPKRTSLKKSDITMTEKVKQYFQ